MNQELIELRNELWDYFFNANKLAWKVWYVNKILEKHLQDLLPEDKEEEVVVNKDWVYHNWVCVKKYSKSRLDIMLCPYCKEKIVIKKL